VAATRAGDDRAFERLYRRYQRRIAAYVHGMVNDHGRAEDITQEVFMSALRRMRETDRPIIFKPWVYEIAKNACIDAFRRSRRAEEVSYDADEGLGSSDHGRLVSRSPTPDVAVDTRMSLDHLRGAFGGLSEMHHDILVMRELEGLSYREIGRRLGMTRPSVESTLFRARRRLSEEYEELASGERCRRIQTLISDADSRRLGVRDERKMARHVSHCQPCRRAAFAAGFDIAALAARTSLGSKVAALLPLPAFVKRRWFGGGGDDGGALAGSSGGGALTHWSAMASQYAEPMSGGWAKAAAIAATMAVAGAGAGIATSEGDDTAAQKRLRPAAARSATPAGAAATPASRVPASRAGGGAGAPAAATRHGSGASQPAAATSRPGAGSGAARRDGASPGGGVAPAANATAGSGSGSSTSTPSSAAAGGGSSSSTAPAKPAVDRPAIGGGSTLGDAVDRLVPKPGGAGSGGGASSTVSVPQLDPPAVGTPVSVPKVPAATGSAPVDTAVSTTTGAVQGATGAVGAGGVGGATGTSAAPSTGTTAGPTSSPVPSDSVGTVTGAANGAVGTVTSAPGSILPGG
jgi:RNA polymerase sigma factor (sigma-70 family)